MYGSSEEYLADVDKWLLECERWQKHYHRQMYILVRHCRMSEEMFWLETPQRVEWKLDLWNEEQESIRQQREKSRASANQIFGPSFVPPQPR